MSYSKILLIDDDEDDLFFFTTALKEISISTHCKTFTNAKLALLELIDKRIDIDVIFIDYNMPIMNGIEFLRCIKKIEHLRDIPVITISTSADPSTVVLTKKLGAMDYITKPDKLDELINIIERIVS